MNGKAATSRAVGVAAVLVLVAVAGVAVFFAVQSGQASSVSSSSSIGTTPSSLAPPTSSSSSLTSLTTGSLTSSSSSTTGSTSSSAAAPILDVVVAVDAHLSNLSSKNIQGAMTAYSDGAVVQWQGKGQTLQPYGMEGTYSGATSIRQLYSATIAQMARISLTDAGLNVSSASTATSVTANIHVLGTGSSSMLGQFNLTADAQITYRLAGGGWLISQEVWNFMDFHSQSTGGATTFPQWQTTGPPLPQRYSESLFKNWVYFYGGAAAAAALAGYVATLPIVALVRRKRRR